MSEEKIIVENGEAAPMPEWARVLLAQQEEMRNTITTLQSENTMLKDIAGKGKMEDWKEKNKDASVKVSRHKVWNGKTIIGWGKNDYSKFNPNAKNPLAENIFIPVKFLDNTEESINYSVFSNIKDLVDARILHRGQENSLIQFESGEQIEILNAFLNP